jgi:hypothetical protein
MDDVPQVVRAEVRPGKFVESRLMTHRGVVVGWAHGSADDALAFVDGLSDQERDSLAAVQVEPDVPGGGAMMALWTKPPPRRLRSGKPERLGGFYPSVHFMSADGWKP